MLRLLILVAWLVPTVASASGLPRTPGMYTTATSTPLPMLDSKIEVTVRGPIVETTVVQTFKNDSENAIEATYIFPLPADAAVSAMAIDLGTRKIHAAIEKRAQAQARYEEAVANGLGAGMLEQERPDVFTQTVSAIPARGTVAVTLRYDATARYGDGGWELALPLVVAPRYVPGTPSGRPTTGSGRNPDTERSPDASRVTPHASPGAGGASQITLAFQTAVEGVTSPSHQLDRASAHFVVTDPKSDHDLIVRWRAKPPAEGWVETEAGGGGFAAALVTGPAAAATHAAARCRLVLDHAATTRGDGDVVERAVVRALLGALDAKDRAGLASGELRPPADLQRALDESWARERGAFDLTRVLEQARPQGVPLVIVTDGLISDDAGAIAAAKKLAVPLYLIGIGPAPNRSLLAALAAATGGTVRFALAGDDFTALARDVITDAVTPPAPLAVSWGTLVATEVVPAQLPRVGAGQAVLVVARVAQARAANARARGDVFALTSFTAPAAPTGATTPRGALARRWARLQLDELLAKGNPRAITEHALAWGLVSPYTAMVAIGDQVIVEGGVKHTRGVPVSLPAGMQWQPVKQETTLELDGTTAKTPAPPPESGNTTMNRPTKKKANEPPKSEKAPAKDDEDDDRKSAPKHKHVSRDEEAPAGADKDADGVDDSPRNMPKPESISISGTAPTIDAREDVELTGAMAGEMEPARHFLRFEISVGAGAAVVNGDATFVQTTRLGVETGRRTLVGGEATLWLGHEVQGTVLGTLTRRGIAPHLDLGGGVGLHLGPDFGPAIDLALRYALTRPLSLYLRYDGALLFHDSIRDGQNTGTFGIEAHF